MISRRNFCLALAGFGAVAAVPAAAQSWQTYSNVRFGTTIEYPDQFRPGRPPTNGGGLSFAGPDGSTLTVWGSHNSLNHDLAGLESFTQTNLQKDGQRITYSARGNNWFVLSGTAGDTIFYQRQLLSHGGRIVNGLEIRHPARLRTEFDPITTRISQSLRAGRGADTEGNP